MDKIIDIHSHVLYGVDDGSRTLKESLEIIDYLKSVGIYDIVLTSHYIKDTKYESDVKTRTEILEKLKSKLNDKDVKLYLGNEVYLCDELVELYKNKKITTLNNSKYMLVELPLVNYFSNFQNVLCEINELGLIPVMAHPERYRFIQKNKKRINEILDYGCLLQCNIDSLTGKYGRDAKRVMKWLLKNDLVTFVATDTHRVGDKVKLEKAYKKLKKLVGEERYEELTYSNPKRILNSKNIKNKYFEKENNW